MTVKRFKQERLNKTGFQTIFKDQVNKLTVGNVSNLSACLEQLLKKQVNKSTLNTSAVKSTREGTKVNLKLKKYVRNMKMAKNTEKIPQLQDDQRNSSRSICSIISIKSQKSSKLSSFKNNKDDDSISIISSRSMRQSVYLSKSKIILPKQTINVQNIKVNRITQLKKLQERLDLLTNLKLNNLMNRSTQNKKITRPSFMVDNSFSTVHNISENQLAQIDQHDMINNQIQAILQCIQNLKQLQYEHSNINIDEIILDVNKKIELLQKIMACNYTESEILKNHYFALKSQKYPYLSRKEKLSNVIAKRKQTLKSSHLSQPKIKNFTKGPIIKYESTSNYFFSKPPTYAYHIQRQNKHTSFALNRQPLPRSMYAREYLNYGTLPSFNYKPHNENLLTPKMATLSTSYQESFKEKNINLQQINYRELDCYRNKILTPKIAFTDINKKNDKDNKKKKILPISIRDDKKGISLKTQQKMNSLRSSLMPQTISKLKLRRQSEMKRQYKCWYNFKNTEFACQQACTKPLLMSLSKDGNLNKLRASLKAQFIR